MGLYFNDEEIAAPEKVYFNGTSVASVYFNGTKVWVECYTAGTASTLYSHSSGTSSVGEGFFRTLETWTATKCGTYNLSGNVKVLNPYPSKIMEIKIYVNGASVHSLYYQGDGTLKEYDVNYNWNMVDSVSAGDVITLEGYLWGNYGNDRFYSSSMAVKVA